MQSIRESLSGAINSIGLLAPGFTRPSDEGRFVADPCGLVEHIP